MDKDLLFYYIRKSGLSVKALCDSIKMPRSTFYRKVNGESEFTLSEMQDIADAVNVKNPTEIFFAHKVS